MTHTIIFSTSHLLRQAGEQIVGTLGNPFVVQAFFSGRAGGVVGGLQACEELSESSVHLIGERKVRHGGRRVLLDQFRFAVKRVIYWEREPTMRV